jgi:glycerophosphoryl diester phosphodiesterase
MVKRISMKKLLSVFGISLFEQSRTCIIIGHRGASGYEPENTLRSFDRAIEMGVNSIEIDVHRCASDEIVVIHDDTVDRTTDGEGSVADLVWDDLKHLDAGNGQRIPLLSQVFNLVNKRVGINIDIKDPNAVSGVVSMIEEYIQNHGWSYNNFLISSFDHENIREVHKRNGAIPVALLFEGQILGVIETVKKTNASLAILDYFSVTKEFITDAHAKNINVFAYTVNAKDIANELIRFGIDGIITDYPDILDAGT